jgi:cysteine desulfurase/selenocysteine lyase
MTLLSDIEIYSLGNELPIILFNVRGVHPHDIASYLDSYNICLRAGFHCAQLVSDLLDEAWTLRISIGVYNNYEDCEKLITRLNEAISYFKGK